MMSIQSVTSLNDVVLGVCYNWNNGMSKILSLAGMEYWNSGFSIHDEFDFLRIHQYILLKNITIHEIYCKRTQPTLN